MSFWDRDKDPEETEVGGNHFQCGGCGCECGEMGDNCGCNCPCCPSGW